MPKIVPASDPSPATCAAALTQQVAEWRAAVAAEERLLGRTPWLTRLAPGGALAVTDPGPLAPPAGFARLGPRGTPLLAAAADGAALRWVAPAAHLQALAALVEHLESMVSTSQVRSNFLPGMGCMAGGVLVFSGSSTAIMELEAAAAMGRGPDWAVLGTMIGLGSAGLVCLLRSVCSLRWRSEASQAAEVLEARAVRVAALVAAAQRREAAAAACARAVAALPLPASAIP